MLINIHYIMNKNKFFILVALAIFAVCFSLASVSAADDSNSSDSLNAVEDTNVSDTLNAPEEVDTLSQENSNDVDNLSVSESSSGEVLTLSTNSSDSVLSTSVSVSSGHTFYKYGYKFKVSDSQYKKIKKAIKAGKKQTFLDWGFKYTVKTNKFEKVKILVKKQTTYKKVRYEGLSKKTHTRVILANLKPYYDAGWQRYYMSYKEANSNKYYGYNYVHFKKTVKKYKTVKMRIYATISYVGEYDYVTGQHSYFPWVSFTAKKSGYDDRYLEGYLLTSY